MYPKTFCGFVVILVVVPIRSAQCKFSKSVLSQKKS